MHFRGDRALADQPQEFTKRGHFGCSCSVEPEVSCPCKHECTIILSWGLSLILALALYPLLWYNQGQTLCMLIQHSSPWSSHIVLGYFVHMPTISDHWRLDAKERFLYLVPWDLAKAFNGAVSLLRCSRGELQACWLWPQDHEIWFSCQASDLLQPCYVFLLLGCSTMDALRPFVHCPRTPCNSVRPWTMLKWADNRWPTLSDRQSSKYPCSIHALSLVLFHVSKSSYLLQWMRQLDSSPHFHV